MPMGIYKPDQGYWVRVLTAVFAGVLVLSAAAWAFEETEQIRLPITAWEMEVVGARGDLQPGQTVDLIAESETDGTAETIGTALVERVEGSRLLVNEPRVEGDTSLINSTDRVRAGTDGGVEFAGEVADVREIPLFQTLYLQTAVAGVVTVIGLAMVYWFVGVQKRFSEFLIATDGEMKKVNWSTRRDIIGSTWVVVGASFLIAALLFAIDFGFQTIMRFLNVLET